MNDFKYVFLRQEHNILNDLFNKINDKSWMILTKAVIAINDLKSSYENSNDQFYNLLFKHSLMISKDASFNIN